MFISKRESRKKSKKQDWIIQTKYNRILRLCDDKADYIIFVDFPLWINVKDILLRLRLNRLKEVLHYQKVRRPWVNVNNLRKMISTKHNHAIYLH